MDSVKVVEYLPDAAMCTLCWELFNEPVTLDCGHNYCSSCISSYWNGSRASCPECNETFASGTMRPNRQLGNIAWLLKQVKLNNMVIVKKQNQCETHQQPLVLFCKDDGVFLCTACEMLEAHSSHFVSSVEVAAQEYKYEIKVLLDVQKHMRESVRASSADMQLEKQNLVRLMEEGVQKLSSEYKELLELVRAIQAEQLILAKAIEKEVDDELSKLYKKRCSLKKLGGELQKKCELADREFLQDIKQTISKCRAESYQPEPCASHEVKEKLWNFTRRNLFLQTTLRRCRETLLLKPKVERATLTLDPATAFSQLLLSDDHKRVIHEPLVYSPVTHPLGFDMAPCVLAAEGFTMGRHCWEVEITSEGNGWALGIAKESVKRKGSITLGQHEGLWALKPEAMAPLSQKAGIGSVRVRLYLHYEAGLLEFFDATSRELLAAIRSLCFAGERVLPFFMLEKQDSYMKLCF